MNEAMLLERPPTAVCQSIIDSINQPAAEELLVEGAIRNQLDCTHTLPVRDLCPSQGVTAAVGFREAITARLFIRHTVVMTELSPVDAVAATTEFRRVIHAYASV